MRPQYRENGSWRLLHDNAPAHRSTLITDFLTKNHILSINHSPYSPDMAPCDFYLFGKLHLAEAIQKACTDILKDIPVNGLKHSLEKLLDRAKQCIEAGGEFFEKINSNLSKQSSCRFYFSSVSFILERTLYIFGKIFDLIN